MSQITKNSLSGPLPPSVATTYTANSGTATPAANNLNVLGTNGISTSGAGSTVTISIQNGISNTTQTIGAVTSDVITVPLSGTSQTYTFDIRVAGISTLGTEGVGYNLFGTVRTNAGSASLVGTPDKIVNEDAILIPADVNLIVSGNSAIIRVLGVAGFTINWGAFAVYVTAT